MVIEVLRDGKEVQVPVPSVVAGDIAAGHQRSTRIRERETQDELPNMWQQVVLGTGDVVPADLRLFEAKDFKVSEMALTGRVPSMVRLDRVPD